MARCRASLGSVARIVGPWLKPEHIHLVALELFFASKRSEAFILLVKSAEPGLKPKSFFIVELAWFVLVELTSVLTYLKASLKVSVAEPVLIRIDANPSVPAGIRIVSSPPVLVRTDAVTPEIVTLVTPPKLVPEIVSFAPPATLNCRAEMPLICGTVLFIELAFSAVGVAEALALLADEVPLALVAVALNV